MTRTVVLVFILGALAALAPSPAYLTDRDIYQEIGRSGIIPDCSSLHCTRVLVPWVLEHLPGPSLLKWKTYAVAGGVVGAAGVSALAAALGEPARVSETAALLAALGGGTQLTLFDPYTSDPLMFALVPWILVFLVRGRFVAAAFAGAAGVFAKEFAAAPLWIFAVAALAARRRDAAIRGLAAAAAVSAVWVVLQLWLALGYNYSFAGSPSSRLLAGGYLARWISELGLVGAAAALVVRLGPLLILAILEVGRAARGIRLLAFASVPAALLLGYVQQPDRALWNFAFVIAPLAAQAIAVAAPSVRWAFIIGYALSNAHLGGVTAWLEIPGFIVASAATIALLRSRAPAPERPVDLPLPHVRIGAASKAGCAFAIAILLALLAVAADVAEHRAHERATGLNVWGYRGPVAHRKLPNETRIVVLGGSTAFGDQWVGSTALYLQDYLNNARLQSGAGFTARGPITVLNLATPCDAPDALVRTLADYETLDSDAVCIYLGDDHHCAGSDGWRRSSAVFNRTGYLPSAVLLGPHPRAVPPLSDSAYVDAVQRTVAFALARGKRVAVVIHPFTDRGWDGRHALLKQRFDTAAAGGRVRFVDLSTMVGPSPDLAAVTGEQLSQSMFRLLAQ